MIEINYFTVCILQQNFSKNGLENCNSNSWTFIRIATVYMESLSQMK